MRSYYTGAHAATYNRVWKAFSQKTLAATLAAIDVEELKRRTQNEQRPLHILDAGCGTGLLLKQLGQLFPEAILYGIDASPDMLAQASHLLHGANVHLYAARLSVGTEAELPYAPAFFDLITCTNTLHYLREPVAILKRYREMLAERGQVVLEDYMLRRAPLPWHWLEWAIRMYDPEHHLLFSQEEVQGLCRQAGFHVEVARTFPIDFFCQGWAVRATCL